jgi:hypothetical protein
MWVPDADLLGSGAPASCDHDDIAIIAHNEKRLGGRGSPQPLPIELNPLGLEPELGGELDEARESKGLTSKVNAPTGGLDPRSAAVLRAESGQARDDRVTGGDGFLQRFRRKLDRLSHSQDAIHFDLRCYLIN